MKTSRSFRIEHDSLGKVRVPRDALYGAQTMRALENFKISGRTAHPELIRAYLRLKRAAAKANQSSGVLKKTEAQWIIRAIDRVLAMSEREWTRVFPLDPYQAGAGTSQNMNMNEVIANVANRLKGKSLGTYRPIHPNDHVNRSQSTNDTYPTAMRLALLEASIPLETELVKLANAFSSKAREWRRLPKSARTHLQDAVPMTLGQEFGAYAVTLRKCAVWIARARDELRELGIGGSAAGTGLTVPATFRKAIVSELSKVTGEKLRSAPDLFEAMQSQASVSYYSSALRVTALELTRICNDIRLLSSGPLTGLAEIVLPSVQPGSSIMPGKVNPSIIEMANQSWFSVLGFDQTIAYCVQAGQLELNVMMPMMAYSALEATRIATKTLTTVREKCIVGLRANEAQLRKHFERTPQIATALSPTLGYELTAKIVQESLASGKSVVDLVREQKLINEKELTRLLNVHALTGS